MTTATQTKLHDPFELVPVTAAGERLVALCEEHAADFATRAEQHDREGSFPFENIEALKQSGVMAACVPEELGGLGVTSVHDWAVAVSRLTRGDGATAIAANMHLAVSWFYARGWYLAHAAGDTTGLAPLEGVLRGIGNGQVVIYAGMSEAGTNPLYPLLTGIRTEEGWVLNGRKIFGSLSEAAQFSMVNFRATVDGQERVLFALIPVGTPGMEISHNWDALGMRGSASHDTIFRDCRIPANGVIDLVAWGDLNPTLTIGLIAGNLPLIGAFLGIAEAARQYSIELVTTRRKAPSNRTLAERMGVQQLIAENEMDLAAMRAMLDRTGLLVDRFIAEHTDPAEAMDPYHLLFKDFQCTKWTVNRKAIEVVDRAMTVSGGSGYLSSNPLSRLYRDVRAGPVMQGWSPVEAFEYTAKVTLGLEPRVDA